MRLKLHMKIKVIGKYGRYCPADNCTNCYLLQTDNGKNIVLDMGSGALSKLQNIIDISLIDVVIITHLHFDHMCDLGVLSYAFGYLKLNKIKVYMPKTPEDVASILNFSQFDIEYIDEVSRFCVDNVIFTFAISPHPVETYAVNIDCGGKKIVYTSDCSDKKVLNDNCKNADIVIGDACILDKDYNEKAPHISVKTLAESVPFDSKLYLAHLTAGEEEEILIEAQKYHKNAEIVKDFEV